jgi:hypothetical protein
LALVLTCHIEIVLVVLMIDVVLREALINKQTNQKRSESCCSGI